jgi:hypothetical protein
VLESVFRDLGLRQDDASLRVVREAISVRPGDDPVRSYMKTERNSQFDAGLVDTFYAGARNYTVDECLDLVTSAEPEFQGWLLKAPYYAHDLIISSSKLHPAINALPEAKQWSVMERIHTLNACLSSWRVVPTGRKSLMLLTSRRSTASTTSP